MSKNIFFLFLFIVLSLDSSNSVSASSSLINVYQNDCLKVPSTEFLSSISVVLDTMKGVTSIISQLGNTFGDFRLSNAVSDCLDLLDFSSEALSWSVSASKSPKGNKNGTGNLGSDLRTWISASLTNQDTCMDGFEGTNGILKNVIAGSLDQLYSLVRELLLMVDSDSDPKPNPNRKPNGYPSWVRDKDMKLLQANDINADADIVVALDGTGNYTKIMDAISAIPNKSLHRYIIHVKKGVYFENVEIKKNKWNVMMKGDGIGNTIISGNRSFGSGWTTFRSATFAVSGIRFIARDITFENTAGPENHQAVALRSDSDLGVFYRCAIRGYQDTLYAHSMRQFYRECIITGTVDFMFGAATAIFQNCQILARQGLPNQKNTITAQGRRDPGQPSGFSIQFCNISADTDLLPNINTTHTYLGRPWKEYSRTVVLQSYLSNAIRPEGWLEWLGNFALDTLYYGEYQNFGPGSGTGKRVTWPGFHLINSSSDVTNFTVSQFIKGDLWLPATGVAFTSGLGV